MRYSPEEIGNKIKECRKTLKPKDRSQDALGKKIGVSGKQISNYEKGKLIPPIDILLKLCDVFGCELGYLLGEEQYSQGTQLYTAMSKEIGLSINAIESIKRIIEKESIRYVQEEYSVVLNKLLCSEYFEKFVESLKELGDIYMRYKDIIPNLPELNENDLNRAYSTFLEAKLSAKYGENVFNLAFDHRDDYYEDENTLNLTFEEREAETEISKFSPFLIDILIRSKGDWNIISEKSLSLLNELEEFSQKYGDDFLGKIWSSNSEFLVSTKEQKKDIDHLYIVKHQFMSFLKRGYELPLSFDRDLLTVALKGINRISGKYSDVVLEKAWEYHKVREAIKEINNAFDKSYGFLYEFKKEMGYSRFLVQECLILLLNDIYPISVDLHNNY